MKILAMVLMTAILMGCNTGMIKTTVTVTEYKPDGKTLAKTTVTVTEDTRGTKQNKANVVGLNLVLPDALGLSSLPAIIKLQLGWINDDMQNTPAGMATAQTKDYGFMFGNTMKTYQVCGNEAFIKSILDKVVLAQAPK